MRLSRDAIILSELNSLKAVSGKKDKIAILQRCHEDTIEFIRRCLDPNVNFYVTKVPKVTDKSIPHIDVGTIEDAYDVIIDRLSTRAVTGKMAETLVESIAASLSTEGRELLTRLLKRDARCGVGVKTLNNAMGKIMIYVPAYMRCSPFNEKTVSKMGLPVISQTKMDGLFVNIIIEYGEVKILTRSGQDITTKVISNETRRGLLSLGDDADWVFHGEAVASYDGNIDNLMSREASNGYMNSDAIDPNRVHFFLWDCLPGDEFIGGKCIIPYERRYGHLTKLINGLPLSNNRVRVLESRELNTVDEIIAHFKEARSAGEEGTIIKNPDGIWKEGTSKDQIKLKVIFDCDLEVTDVIEGEGKYAGMLGALTASSSCGQVKLNIGTGFSDGERESLWNDDCDIIDKIVAIKANDVTVTKRDDEGNPTEYALFLPRFIEFRNDKDEADDLDRIREQVLAFTDTLKLLES